MFDNMAGSVGFAMHADRLARIAKNVQIAEAKRGRHAAVNGGGYRKALAMAMAALAARIAPSVAIARGRA